MRSLDCSSSEGYLLDIYGAPALVRTDALGNVIWSAYNDTILADTRFAPDGGAIVTGVTPSQVNRYPLLLLQKTDPTGKPEWTMPPPHNWSLGRAVEATSDGGFLAIGTIAIFNEEPAEIRENTTYNLGILLVRADIQGNTLWTSTLSAANYNEGIKVHETPDGGYIVLGTTADEAGLEYLLFLGNIPGKIYLAKLAGYEVTGDGIVSQTPSFTPITTVTPVISVDQVSQGAEDSPGATSTSQEIPLVIAPLLAILGLIVVIWHGKR
ncbi:hypothetical protein J2741_002041 [Methanolinea mesophila]|uniref:hypothetical protein n=1 Tax=Methanolinea mesophila TaxID=547055 RepID=UPI001AE813EC|nr:hypothetical protein [Methanolinea mesophila]MBP1929494.1 hypothetical protein [Methanolinea mesophila]